MSDHAYQDWISFLASIDLPWCVVVTKPGREMAVQANLARAGWSTYLPMQTVWSGKGPGRARRPKNVPLLLRYVLAACNPGGDLDAPKTSDDVSRVHWAPEGKVFAPRAWNSVVYLPLLARLMLTELRHGFDLTYQKPRAGKKGGLVCGQPVTVRAGLAGGMDGLIAMVLSEREALVRLPIAICGQDEFVIRAEDLDIVHSDERQAA